MEFTVLKNRIEAVVDGKVLAEIDFPACEGGVDICHTFVDDSLRGQGVAGQLMRRCADELRRTGRKACSTCSYAAAWFTKHPEESDLLL